MEYVKKHNLHIAYPYEFKMMTKLFDTVLQRTYASYKSSELSGKLWWAGVGHIASLLIPPEEMDLCCAVPPGGSWEPVAQSLYAVVNSCETGMCVFGFAVKKMHSGKTTKFIKQCVEGLLSNDIADADVEANRALFLDLMKQHNIDPNEASSAYKVKNDYRGIVLTSTVRSPLDEYVTAREVAVRGLAVDAGVLSPMSCENYFVQENRPVPDITIANSVVANCGRARATAAELLRGVEELSGSTIVATLKSKQSILHGIDKRWNLDFTLIESHVGDKGETRCRDCVLQCLPTDGSRLTLEQSYAKLVELCDGKLVKFCGAGMGDVFRNVRDTVGALMGDKCASFTLGASPFMTEVRHRLGDFLTFSVQASSTQVASTLYGREAAVAHLKVVRELVATKDPAMCMRFLTPLQVFKFLLNDDEITTMTQWTNIEFAKGSVVAADAVSKGRGKGGRKRATPSAREALDLMLKT